METPTNTRPKSITVLAWILIAPSVLGLITSLILQLSGTTGFLPREGSAHAAPLSLYFTLQYAGSLVTLIAGVGLLKGKNWGRTLYSLWFILWLPIVAAMMPLPAAASGWLLFLGLCGAFVWFLIFAYFVSRPKANAFFRQETIDLPKGLRWLASLKLTVISLAYAMFLVFLGTIAQGSEGLYQVQARFFKSLAIAKPFHFIYLTESYASLSDGARHLVDPLLALLNFLVIPGGYLVGGILLINFVLSYLTRSQFSFRNLGLMLVHAGLISLLLGQLSTDFSSRESSMRLVEGQSKNYSEDFSKMELALINTSDAQSDQTIAVPESRLAAGNREIRLPGSPFSLRVKQYWPNAQLLETPSPQSLASGATAGEARQLQVLPRPEATKTDERSLPACVVEIASPRGAPGSYLVSPLLQPQSFSLDGKNYSLALRSTRYYYPFNITLLKFHHDVYKGTDIPKNFSSQINLLNPITGEQRHVLIRMNEPLRYQGITFYQGSYDPNDPRVSILQVVRNPGWLTPYISCALVGVGLTWQFLLHLVGFIHERKTAPSQPAVTKTV